MIEQLRALEERLCEHLCEDGLEAHQVTHRVQALACVKALRSEYEQDELVTLILESDNEGGCWDDPDPAE